MYWIVFALFSAAESLLDPLVSFWLPFYSEFKVSLLLYLTLPMTRGSSPVYRRWIHPLLLSKEEEIDSFLETLREQGYYTVRGWVQTGITWLGGALINTAIKGGGGLMYQLRRSYSMTDFLETEWRGEERFTDVTDQFEQGQFSPSATPSMRRRQLEPRVKPFSPSRILSNESISSGYISDAFSPVETDTLDTGDYEIWDRRWGPGGIRGFKEEKDNLSLKADQKRDSLERKEMRIEGSIPQKPPRVSKYEEYEDLSKKSIQRTGGNEEPKKEEPQNWETLKVQQSHKRELSRSKRIGRSRAQILRSNESDDEEDTFYESLQTPFGQPLPAPNKFEVQSPESSCYPSDRESTIGEYSDEDFDEVKSDILDNIYVQKTPQSEAMKGDTTPTILHAPNNMTVEELKLVAKRLNLSLVSSKEEHGVGVEAQRRSGERTGATPLLESEEDDTGTILYRSPGYPTISSELPIKERPVPFSSTRIFTHSPMTGITRLRRYDVEEEEQSGKSLFQEEPRARKLFVEEPTIGKFTGENLKEKKFTLEEKISKSPPVPPPRAEYLGNSQSSRCPHCTIHTWLPHSPGCSNKK